MIMRVFLKAIYSFFLDNLKFHNHSGLIISANKGVLSVFSKIQEPIYREKTVMKFDNILGMIGDTPYVRINSLDTNGVNIFLKMESFNPGGSIKDRIAVSMLEEAERKGLLRKGMTVIEPSSVNTAIVLAMACASKGYKFIAVLDQMVPAAKRDKIRAFGADIIYLPVFEDGVDTVLYRIDLTKKIVKNYPNSFSPMQFENSDNPETHYSSTAREIYNQFGEDLDGIFVTAGSCGTITGVSKYFKEKKHHVRITAVEPEGSIIFGGEPGKYFIQGAGLAFRPSILDDQYIDSSMKISDFTAFKIARDLASKEGILLGGTGACALAAALESLDSFKKNDTVVVVIPDSGERYVDTIYNDNWLNEHNFSDLVFDESGCDSDLKNIIKELGCTFNDF